MSVCRTPCVVCTVSNCAREGQRTDETQLTLSHNLRPVHRLLEGHDNADLVGIFLIINFSDKGVYTNGVPRTTVWFVKFHCQIVKLRGISDIYLFISTEKYKRYLCYCRCTIYRASEKAKNEKWMS